MNISHNASPPNDKNALGVTYETAHLVGNRLKDAREKRRLSPSQVSARVKIRDRYIEAIEQGDWDVLPPGLNGRGLIRLYAKELGVSIPEFEAFHHLQTVMVERQSESLTNQSIKKSKYHPAAEESAEVIRSISRKDFQKGLSFESFNQHDTHGSLPQMPMTGESKDRQVPSFHQNKVYQTATRATPLYPSSSRSSHPNNIVTPNAFEVLGLHIEEDVAMNFPQEQTQYKVNSINTSAATSPPPEMHTKSAQPKSHESGTLPNATPVKMTAMPEAQGMAESQLEMEFTAPPEQPTYHAQVLQQTREHHREKKESLEKKSTMDMSPMKILVGLAFLVIVGFVTLLLSSKNSQQIKVTNLSANPIESPLINEDGTLVPTTSSNPKTPNDGAKKTSESNTASQQPTQTVAAGGVNISSQKVTSSMVIERTAKLNITSSVTILIEVDGKPFFSGVRKPGLFEIPFKKSAEITINDASKASLNYEGWEHGPLGYAGRKRKLVLEAQPYNEG